jgi:hypothetical protein
VDRTNWNGKALVFPPAAWAQHSVTNQPELQQTGVYLLQGPREDSEGDPINLRLDLHQSEKDLAVP